MANITSQFWNEARMVIEGTFDLNSSAAVLSITYPAGQTKTVRGKGMTVSKTGTGTYVVVVKNSSSLLGATFQPVEFVGGDACIVASTVATALSARLGAAPTVDANGNLNITVITAQTTGAAADTTGAITVAFEVVLVINRMDQAL
jgi:hypothetical protein